MMPANTLSQEWRLAPLLAGIMDVAPAQDVPVCGIATDSREVVPGDLFIAVSGSQYDGARYIEQAIQRGAAAVLWEMSGNSPGLPRAKSAGGVAVPVIAVPGLRRHVGHLCSRFFHEPSRALMIIGVTGTNGKSSVASYVAQGLQREHNCGLIGTLGTGFWNDLTPSPNTTPGPLALQRNLRRFVDTGARYAVMEVSSHGLHQGRINGTDVNIAVFTNLSHEHLDYHGDMESYGLAKKLLFDMPSISHGIVNIDDDFGKELAAGLPAAVDVITYSLVAPHPDHAPRVYADAISLHAGGLRFELHSDWGSCRIESALLGRFNIANLLATFGVFMAMPLDFEDAVERVRHLLPVAGRMEIFTGDGGVSAVVDYAHTPDALAQVLAAVRVHCTGRLWCVFGCGGDRDPAKRPLMGAVAEAGADQVIVTDDNPRTEAPASIVEQILAGMKQPGHAAVRHDRHGAIEQALASAQPGDVVVIAGKGHEDYQLIGDRRIPFSDRQVVRQCMRIAGNDAGQTE